MTMKNFRGWQHAAESVDAPLNNARIGNATIADDRRLGRSSTERSESRESTRKLAAADAHLSIVEWDTCRKSW